MPRRQLDIDLFRGVLRRLKYATGESSYPFISGDTYAALCDYRFNQEFSLADLKNGDDEIKLFLPASLKDLFLSKLDTNDLDFSHITLIIHNSDNIPNEAEMMNLSSRFNKVYSVNWLGDRSIATPIPIGIENWSHLRNGVPKDFAGLVDKGLLPTSKRSIKILSAFSLNTNLAERSKAIEFSKSNSDVFQLPAFTSPREYRAIVANSRFVLSPPGNGVDCHRTWESIYLGAIPIVLKKSWPFCHLDLPVLVVDDWVDIPKLIEVSSDWTTHSIEELRNEFLSFN